MSIFPASRDSRLLADRWLSGCGWASRPQQSSIARANRLGRPVSRDLDPAVSARLMPSRFVAGSCQVDVRVWMSGLAQLLMLKSLEPYIIGMSKGWPRSVPTHPTRRRRHGHRPGESDQGELHSPSNARAACTDCYRCLPHLNCFAPSCHACESCALGRDQLQRLLWSLAPLLIW